MCFLRSSPNGSVFQAIGFFVVIVGMAHIPENIDSITFLEMLIDI